MDFRRSGSVEAIAGEAPPAVLAAKMANTIDQNKELQATYLRTRSPLSGSPMQRGLRGAVGCEARTNLARMKRKLQKVETQVER
jgi:hypothetical protein